MIKNGTYIRKFTTKQMQQMGTIATEQKLKTVPSILFYALETFSELKKDNARLERLIQYKQNKIEKLTHANI